MTVENRLDLVMTRYQTSFMAKNYSQENEDHDLLMDAFGITPQLKQENKQYWGRELGKCWKSLVIEACRNIETFQPALTIGKDEPCDLRVRNFAIDTKYRIGSGDSGTLKKFEQYGRLLIAEGYVPVLLFLRADNLTAAIRKCERGQWTIYVGQKSFNFIKDISGFDMKAYLIQRAKAFPVNR